MADSFIQKLRMKGLFGGDNSSSSNNSTPFGMPNFGGNNGSSARDLLDSYLPGILAERQKDRDLQLQLAGLEDLTGRSLINSNRGTPLRNIANGVARGNPSIPPGQDHTGMALGPVGWMPYGGFKGDINPEVMPAMGQQKEAFDLQKKALDVKNDTATQNAQIKAGELGVKQQRANVYEYKAKNPDAKIITPGDGRVYAVNPQSGETTDLGIDTLSDQEKLELQGNQRMEQINRQGEIGSDLESQRQTGRENLQKTAGEQRLGQIAAQGEQNRETNAAKPELPSQQKTAQINAANTLRNTRPDLAKFINIDPTTGSVTITPPGSTTFSRNSPTQGQFDEINKAIYGVTRDINLPPEGNNEKPPAGAKPGGKWVTTSYGRVYQEP